ncbi:energy-coupling factor ABC transporter ATP-binding protein [Tuanshanicoccus lijuaniae]|uniref:energy-coupling factor ABC transporter ATP-binding protein n=1 Tax=Aerococcaceae bacterium zg-1292 TaxID=2774330 RepID=UPI0019369A2D|nr:energy-coupling factor ABC transporter ATP-binding protein [Aerococcaceae bacterium zg-1292]MBF6978399.1 energy-coupling factor ABC transporter ATP-binding protein [Aerococcaceae bacterium zg-BR22]MBS4456208.1 energy-coupling factor ABC transporter ATP-binding protein [Aerococcaceae bacterium zg-A91]MBS4458059.1 energy-coupling factor ABC transporter ATP-binding protein [Aerococcaceae bacterium zg-BR33]QQA37300.1 energy-coupling factor ABC transporter ATP-binding protein [Aerococcaceae bacte
MVNNIVFDQVSYTYNANSPFEYRALYDINLEIPAGKITAIVGHTGSGKSTLLQHLNVLVRPTTGSVTIAGEKVTATSKHESLKPLRKKVGVVFQFPEAQLFEETVLKDVMFGPLNFGATEDEAARIAREKLALVGISEALFNRSPFDLSGGQMRRVAIAGVLALEPEILVLDEPTAGLDPMGHFNMLEMFVNLQKTQKLTMVMVTHHMEDVVAYAEHVIVMNQGTKLTEGSPEALFKDDTWLNDYQLGLPNTLQFMKRLEQQLGLMHTYYPLSVEALIDAIIALKDEGAADVR